MKIYIGSDHGGFELKQKILETWSRLGVDFKPIDVGCYTNESVNYPDLAEKVCSNIITDFKAYNPVSASEDAFHYGSLGILVCGSGQGMAMKANKYPQIRAALCWNPDITTLSREHNNANILCLPGRFLTPEVAMEMLKIFLTTPFAKGRHSTRVDKI